MNALVRKEWREHVVWVALPSLLLLGPMAVFGVPLLIEPAYLAYVSLVAALFGALLGFVQVYPEAAGDKRSILMHRPIGPARIFLSKAIAGATLYALALGAPTLVVIVLALTPGHIGAPFLWGTSLPWLADVLTGLVYYFAGMLVAQREARWYGSRCLPLAAGLCASLFVWNVTEFGHALVAIGLAIAVVGAAAWGAFVAGGTDAPRTRTARLALAGTLLMGLSALSFTAKLLIGAEFLRPLDYFPFEVSRWGQALIVEKENWWIDGRLVRITDLAGEVPRQLQGERMDAFAFRKVVARGAMAGTRPKSLTYRSVNRFLQEFKNETTPSAETWWYVPAWGEALGYDKETRNLIGRFGPEGFMDRDRPVPRPFRGEPPNYQLGYRSQLRYPLAFPDGAYTVDFRKGKVERVFAPPPGEAVVWASQRKDELAGWMHMFVGTLKHFHVLDESGAPVCSARLPLGMEDYRLMMVGRAEDPRRYLLTYVPRWELPRAVRDGMLEFQVVVYDAEGREIPPRQTVQPRPGAVRDFPTLQLAVGPCAYHALAGFATSPVEALFLVGTTAVLEAEALLKGGSEVPLALQFLAGADQLFIPGMDWDPRSRPDLVAGFAGSMLCVSLVCATLCYTRPRRYAWSRAHCLGWAACGLLFGLVGLLLMIALVPWPARITCRSCGRPRVVTRDRCEHCGEAHAEPEPDGTEIFEDDSVATPALLATQGNLT